jgi:hypothetical protein
MGLLRLYLAACVVAAHSGNFLPWSIHGGKEAVEVFFVISGFYMQLILSSGKYIETKTFYRSRLERIFLPYYISLSICFLFSLIWWSLSGNGLTCQTILTAIQLRNSFGKCDLPVICTNFTILFQDLVMFIDRDINGKIHITNGTAHSATQFY